MQWQCIHNTAPGSFPFSAVLVALFIYFFSGVSKGSEAVQAFSSRIAQNEANCGVSMSVEHHHGCKDGRKDHRLQNLKPH